MGREDELSGTTMCSQPRRCRTCIQYLAGWEQEEVQTDRQLPSKWRGTHRMEGETHTPPKGRAQGREAYDFITGPKPMTSPGGRGARPSKLFMEKGRRPGTDPDPEPFQMWLDTASSWPSGTSKAGRQAGRGERGKAGGIQLMGAGLLEAHGSFSRDFQSSRLLPLGICSSLCVLVQNSPAVRLADFRQRCTSALVCTEGMSVHKTVTWASQSIGRYTLLPHTLLP